MLDLFRLAIVGIISGLFSSLIAYRSHRQKKWWEIRVDSYTKLIESLSDVTHYFSSHYDAHTSQRDLSEKYTSKLSDAWDQGFPRVRRAADTGAFIYSPSVNINRGRELGQFRGVARSVVAVFLVPPCRRSGCLFLVAFRSFA